MYNMFRNIKKTMDNSADDTKARTVGKLHDKISNLYVDGAITQMDALDLHSFVDFLYRDYLDEMLEGGLLE